VAASKTPARKPLMAGNWKMNLNHLEAIGLVQKLSFSLADADYEAVDVAVLPPFTDLRSVQTMVDGDHLRIMYGGQDVSAHAAGAYTGEISAAMLARLGCTFVVVGHSERRQYHHEDDELVNAKVKATLTAGMTPILCVGEALAVRQAGEQVPHTLAQLDGALAGVSPEQAAGLVIAYEPVWAIGTGEVATPEDAQEVCAAIRGRMAQLYSPPVADDVRVLYGGSVKGSNASGIMAQRDIDGALIGGASLDVEDFVRIIRFGAPETELAGV
jgi:triosephosphate isomerase (TIM)